jgi:hypothetical protein
VALEVDDGIPDQLTGTVKGDIATSLYFEKLDALCSEKCRARDEIFFFRRSSERYDGWMLYE